jgi:hypothetical protein
MKNTIAFMLNWQILENKKIILLYQFAYAVLIGVCGTTLVIMFLTTILPLSKTTGFIPWLIGFNTAMTGYALVDKTRSSLKYRYIIAIGAGISNVLITVGILIGLSVYTTGISLFSPSDLTICLIIGVTCSAFGAWLAAKYHRLKKKNN